MPAYVPILDAQIDPESPITEALMTALRDNPIAIVEGSVGAPRMQTGILAIGGSIADGTLSDASAFANRGYYDLVGGTRTTALALPAFSFIRLRGNTTISSTITVDTGTDATLNAIVNYFNAIRGVNGGDGTVNVGAGGGGSVGAGGNGGTAGSGNGAVGLGATTGLSRPWVNFARRPLVGGRGGRFSSTRAEGGGAVILLVEGNLDMTGGTINADGQAGSNTNANTGGGGGAGSVLVICTGTLTGGTFRARGGEGGFNVSTGSSGGGGGGNVIVVAAAYAGVQTLSAAGGNSTDSGSETSTNGSTGSTQQLTVSEPLINGLYWR